MSSKQHDMTRILCNCDIRDIDDCKDGAQRFCWLRCVSLTARITCACAQSLREECPDKLQGLYGKPKIVGTCLSRPLQRTRNIEKSQMEGCLEVMDPSVMPIHNLCNADTHDNFTYLFFVVLSREEGDIFPLSSICNMFP